MRYVTRVAGTLGAHRMLTLGGLTVDDPRLGDESAWCTYDEAIRLFDAAVEVTRDVDAPERIGEELLRQYADSEVAVLLRALGSPSAVLENVAASGSKFSTVTTMRPIEVAKGSALIEVRTLPPFDRHPHFCRYAAGVLSQSSALFGLGAAEVDELECAARGAERCLYRVDYPVHSPDPALQVVRLEQEVAGLVARMESLEAAATELVAATTIDEVLTAVTRRASHAVRAPQFLVAVHLGGERAPRVRHDGFASDEAAAELAEAVLRGGDAGGGSLLVVDIATMRTRFGAIAAGYPGAGGFLPHERHLLAAYARHAAAVLETVTALEDARRKNAAAGALLELARGLASARSEDDVAQRVAEALPLVVGSAVAAVLVREEGADVLRFRGLTGLPEPAVDALKEIHIRPSDTDVLCDLIENPRPIILDRTTSDPFIAGILEVAGTRAACVVPIVVQDELAGVIGADIDDEQPLGDVVERLEAIADQAATALLNARLVAAVREQALHDPLTGLPNARFIAERADVADHAERMAVLFIDLDHFKPVNDRFGHAIGDDVLRQCAERLRGVLRSSDVVARLGGDEFVVLITDLDCGDHAAATAERLCRALDEPFVVADNLVQLSSSIGVALFPDHGTDFDALLKRADAAMYSAKTRRRGTFELA